MIFEKQTQVSAYSFNSDVISDISLKKFGRKWPVVYILEHDGKQLAYVGETTNIVNRASQHLGNSEKNVLENIHIIHNESFNKSVILDLESFLIKYIAGDGKYKLLNGNGGQHVHNYYQRKEYQEEFRTIWQLLKKKGLVNNDINVIENTDLFKYSPYKTLTPDQYYVAQQFIQNLKEDISNDIPQRLSIINGGAGTGKSILGIFLLKLLIDTQDNLGWTIEEDTLDENLNAIVGKLPDLNIGYVVPMKNFRSTLRKVFKDIKGLKSKMVLSPADVARSKEKYDLLIVDEAHRLRQRRNLSSPGDFIAFDKKNESFGLGQEGTELDWILKKSRYQILFYDKKQSVRPTDIPKEKFDILFEDKDVKKYVLQSQLRCKGGDDYIKYLDEIFNCSFPKKIYFKEYEFKLYEDVNDMVNAIIQKDKEFGLCRNVAGYAWEWKTKGKTLAEINEGGLYDIDISKYRYIWNMSDTDWINSKNSVNEIGCIHTTQGFDLNYAGVILGPEISYDAEKREIIVDKGAYKDSKGKLGITDLKELLSYIKNIYQTIMERGIQGTYVYACDPELRKYLENFIDVVPHIEVGDIIEESEVATESKYIEFLPYYSLKAACGYFGEGEDVVTEGWMKIPTKHFDDQLFVVQAIGDSMQPRIYSGDYCIFRANPQGSRKGKIVLAQHSSMADPETGGSYTIKQYYSERIDNDDETWMHTNICLKPLNSEYSPIIIDVESSDDFKIIGELIDIIKKE